MNASDTLYLIILSGEDDEREAWGFTGNDKVAITIDSTTERKWKWDAWHNATQNDLRLTRIFVYSDHGLRGRQDKCKRKLHELVGDKFRIWHHGGGVQSTITIDKVRKEFGEKFSEAGFSNNVHLMPFSVITEFPWKTEISNVRDNLFKKNTSDSGNALTLDDAITQLDKAWDKASTFFHSERPIQLLLEALFPLYVDLKNHQGSKLSNPDLSEALKAAMDNLNRSLNEAGQPTANQLLDAIKIVIKSKTGTMADMLLVTTDILDISLNLKYYKLDGKDEFIKKFDALSDIYSKYLGLPLEMSTEQSEGAK